MLSELDSTDGGEALSISLQYERELKIIQDHQLNFSTVNVLLFSYGQLQQLGDRWSKADISVDELFLANEALTTSVVACYGRLFTRGNGATKLNPDKIPAEHKAAHEELMSLRHERYAHNGKHDSVTTNVRLSVEGNVVTVYPGQDTGTYIGGSNEWGPLFLWINRHLVETMEGYRDHLSKKTGLDWRMSTGPQPPWMDAVTDTGQT